jgi:hypothetical protein
MSPVDSAPTVPGIEPRSPLSRSTVLALLGLALVLVVAAAWPRVQALLDRTIPSRIAARAIGKSLLKLADTVGPVEVSGAELRLFKGKLRLVVSKPRDAGNDKPMGHFHVVATVADAPTAPLDACIIGVGDSPEKRLESVAEAFVGVAFPPVLSHFRGEPVLDARLSWGDEPWGVPGMHGYVGPVLGRGSVDGAPFMDAPLFSNVPDLPRDGKLHLIKAVLYSKDGFWLRTVELDGRATGVSERRFSPLDPHGNAGMIVRYAVFDRPATPAAAAGRDDALERLKAREAWLFPAGDCPADLIPAALPAFSFSSTACRGGRLLDCLLECRHGAASFCYVAAQEILPTALDAAAAQALFLRSCRLGFASGCTNAAAGRLARGRPMDECSLRTFQQICERVGDPWACAMFGAALARGDSTRRDPARARTVLAKACHADQEDPACQAAKAILSSLDASPARPSASPK